MRHIDPSKILDLFQVQPQLAQDIQERLSSLLPDEQEQQEQQSDSPREEMSEEDAQRILDALKEEEKNAQKSRQVVPKMRKIYIEKDW